MSGAAGSVLSDGGSVDTAVLSGKGEEEVRRRGADAIVHGGLRSDEKNKIAFCIQDEVSGVLATCVLIVEMRARGENLARQEEREMENAHTDGRWKVGRWKQVFTQRITWDSAGSKNHKTPQSVLEY